MKSKKVTYKYLLVMLLGAAFLFSMNAVSIKFQNTPVAMDLYNGTIDTDGDYIACSVMDQVYGSDVDNDGNLNDLNLMYYDMKQKKLFITGCEIFKYQQVKISGTNIIYIVYEPEQKQDFNGNGNMYDPPLLMCYNIATKSSFCTGLYPVINTSYPAISGDNIALILNEGTNNTDYNADGDKADNILCWYNVTTKVLKSTKTAVNDNSIVDISDSKIIFSRSESVFAVDFNADGDKTDIVLSVYDISKLTTQLVKASFNTIAHLTPKISKNQIALVILESVYNIDYNTDGDKTDKILAFYNLTNNSLAATKECADQDSINIENNIITFVTSESSYNRDLNGNGTSTDKLVCYYDTIKRSIVYTDISPVQEFYTYVYGIPSGVTITTTLSNNIIACSVYESVYGRDLNGDSDTSDIALVYFNIADPVLGCESVTDWTAPLGALASSLTIKTRGNASIQLKANGSVQAVSKDVSTTVLSMQPDYLTFDVYIGSTQPNPSWYGSVQVLIDCPAAGIYSEYLGQLEFTSLPLNTFSTLKLLVPNNVKAALVNPANVFKVTLSFNTNIGSGPYYFDNIWFNP